MSDQKFFLIFLEFTKTISERFLSGTIQLFNLLVLHNGDKTSC